MLKKPFYLLLIVISLGAHAQQKNMKELPLNDLSSFRDQAGNWSIVGDVTMDRNIDVHPVPAETPAPSTKKGKKSKSPEAPPKPKAVTFTAGSGVLLNMNDDSKKDQLVTQLTHGDLDLEFEVMLPKGSNSGVYLQGRYEVQLLDSWGVKKPAYSDIATGRPIRPRFTWEKLLTQMQQKHRGYGKR
jgi:hypothetical protein